MSWPTTKTLFYYALLLSCRLLVRCIAFSQATSFSRFISFRKRRMPNEMQKWRGRVQRRIEKDRQERVWCVYVCLINMPNTAIISIIFGTFFTLPINIWSEFFFLGQMYTLNFNLRRKKNTRNQIPGPKIAYNTKVYINWRWI